MPNPATLRERRLRKTRARLIDEIDMLEQRAAAIEAAHGSGAPMRAKASDRYLANQELADLALAEKESQLRLALDNMPGGMMLLDRDMNYVLFNARYIELFEYPAGLVKIGGSLRDAWRFQAERGDFGPGDTDDLVEQVLGLYQRGKAASWEREIASIGRTLDGSSRQRDMETGYAEPAGVDTRTSVHFRAWCTSTAI